MVVARVYAQVPCLTEKTPSLINGMLVGWLVGDQEVFVRGSCCRLPNLTLLKRPCDETYAGDGQGESTYV